jgi:acyl-CoA thioester hydrolase
MEHPSSDAASSPTIRIVAQRVVEWSDTDASGHYHHSTVIRWVEAAEAELYERLGLHLFGTTPRVRYEVDYVDRLWLGDRVDIELTVASVGRTSLHFEFSVRRGEQVAARGRMTCVNSQPEDARAAPWPDRIRSTLLGVDPAGSS